MFIFRIYVIVSKTYEFYKSRVFRGHVFWKYFSVGKIPTSGAHKNFCFLPTSLWGVKVKKSRWTGINSCFFTKCIVILYQFLNTFRGIVLQYMQRVQNYPCIKIITITMTFFSSSDFICHGKKSIWCWNTKEKGVSWKKDLACTSSICLTLFEAEVEILHRSMWTWVHTDSSFYQPRLALSDASWNLWRLTKCCLLQV